MILLRQPSIFRDITSKDELQTAASNGMTPQTAFAPCYDGNGNITELCALSTQTITARYEYSAFGETITVDGSAIADSNPFRFSTKYEDRETGFYYYGYRYFAPETGRWLSRDPIGEQGGVNLYGMVGNDAVNRVDKLGLIEILFSAPTTPSAADDASDDAINSMLFGSGDTSRFYGPEHAWTAEMKRHEWMDTVRAEIKQKRIEHCTQKGGDTVIGRPFIKHFNLDAQSVLTNARMFMHDVFAGFGMVSSVHSTGSFRLIYTIQSIDCAKCEAAVTIHAWDRLSFRSLTRIPKVGSLPDITAPDFINSALDSIAGPEFSRNGDKERAKNPNPKDPTEYGNNPFGASGRPLNSIDLTWLWNEDVK